MPFLFNTFKVSWTQTKVLPHFLAVHLMSVRKWCTATASRGGLLKLLVLFDKVEVVDELLFLALFCLLCTLEVILQFAPQLSCLGLGSLRMLHLISYILDFAQEGPHNITSQCIGGFHQGWQRKILKILTFNCIPLEILVQDYVWKMRTWGWCWKRLWNDCLWMRRSPYPSFPLHHPFAPFVLLFLSSHHPFYFYQCPYDHPSCCQNLFSSLFPSCCSTQMPHSSSCDVSSPPLQSPLHLTHSMNRFHCCLSLKMMKKSESRFVPFPLSFAPSQPVFELSPFSAALSNAPLSLSVSGYLDSFFGMLWHEMDLDWQNQASGIITWICFSS